MTDIESKTMRLTGLEWRDVLIIFQKGKDWGFTDNTIYNFCVAAYKQNCGKMLYKIVLDAMERYYLDHVKGVN